MEWDARFNSILNTQGPSNSIPGSYPTRMGVRVHYHAVNATWPSQNIERGSLLVSQVRKRWRKAKTKQNYKVKNKDRPRSKTS